MMITEIALVTRKKMDEFKAKFGGLTHAALDEITRLEWGGTWEVSKYPPGIKWHREDWGKYEPIDLDRRYAERGLRALELVHSRASKDASAPTTVALADALSVYRQVVPGYADFDDSGGAERAVANVLSPERCKALLECWAVIDLASLEQGIQEYPGVFEEVGPAYVFKDAKQFIEYVRDYVRYLGQAVAEDRYFVSFFA